MTITYTLAPIPRWIIINEMGTVAGGAKLYTRRSLNKDEDKPVYQDAGGLEPYTNPIIFGLNGVAPGAFYWAVDSADLADTYYIFVTDADGNLLWDQDDYAPTGSGGGSDVTTYLPIRNYIANNQFSEHSGDTASPINSTNVVLAPSNHKGFTPAMANPLASTHGVLGPDIRFIKNNTNATDQITFGTFALASSPLSPDVTPTTFIEYVCANSPLSETFKNFQFPITQKVKNLSQQAMTFSIWAAVASTPATIQIYFRQYYGSGTGSTGDTRTPIGAPITLTTTWTKYIINFTVPDVSAGSLGTPGKQTGDDASYIQVEMPLGSTCDIMFTKPALYLGTVNPNTDFDSYDEIQSISQTVRTGDTKPSYWATTTPLGWLPMNDGSIGNVGSGGTLAAGEFTFNLYTTLYTTVSNTWAPVSGGRTAPGNNVASAITDFLAGKTLTIPAALGRAIASAGAGSGLTARALGQSLGSQTISIAAMPAHTHPAGSGNFVVTGPSTLTVGADFGVAQVANTGITGGGAADGNMPPTTFQNVFIKL